MFLLILSVFSISLFATTPIDCKKPENTQETRECAVRELQELKKELAGSVSDIANELLLFSGGESSKELIDLQKEWEEWVQRQCMHQRKLYGRGSFSGISYIECEKMYYKERIENLDTLYKSILFPK